MGLPTKTTEVLPRKNQSIDNETMNNRDGKHLLLQRCRNSCCFNGIFVSNEGLTLTKHKSQLQQFFLQKTDDPFPSYLEIRGIG